MKIGISVLTMKKNYTLFGIAQGIVMVATSYFSLSAYYIASNMDEVRLLKGTSVFIQKYEGNPKEALDYAQKTLKLIENPQFIKSEEIESLETKISDFSKKITDTSPKSEYKPFFEEISKPMEDASNEPDFLLKISLISGLSAAINFFALFLYSLKKEEEKNN